MREPLFFADGEVDEIRADVRNQVEVLPPRVPRDRVLSIGGMFWFACAVGAFLWGAGYLVWEWAHG